jgi:hypothetical protein
VVCVFAGLASSFVCLLNVEAYAQQLAAAGFADVTAEDCTAEVWCIAFLMQCRVSDAY